jgi:large subunit ribosomal protein L24
MRAGFSKHWTSSARPRNQRKARKNAPLHIREKFLHANLSPELREKYQCQSMPVHAGDKVKVMRGTFKGKISKVMYVNHSTLKVQLEEIKRKKTDGRDIHIPFQSSNLQIVSLLTDDKKRLKALERKKKRESKATVKAEDRAVKTEARDEKKAEKADKKEAPKAIEKKVEEKGEKPKKEEKTAPKAQKEQKSTAKAEKAPKITAKK